MTNIPAEYANYNIYGYIPNLPANGTALALFGFLLAVQIGQGLWYRQWWFAISWWCGLVLQVLGFIGRVMSHFNTHDFPVYKMQLACLTISPAFLMAGIYYQLAKLTTVYGLQYSVLPPMGYSVIFVLCDLFSIIIQGVGGGLAAAGAGVNPKLSRTGGHIMLAGMAFQVASMLAFMAIFGIFIWKTRRDDPANYEQKYEHIRSRPAFKYFIPSLCLAVLFIFVRSVYRVAELSDGWSSYIIRTERYQLVCDGLMVLLSSFVLTIIYPGFALGREVIPVQGIHYKKKDALNQQQGEIEKAEETSSNQPSSESAYSEESQKQDA